MAVSLEAAVATVATVATVSSETAEAANTEEAAEVTVASEAVAEEASVAAGNVVKAADCNKLIVLMFFSMIKIFLKGREWKNRKRKKITRKKFLKLPPPLIYEKINSY